MEAGRVNEPIRHRALDEFEAKKLLAQYGIPVVGEARANNIDDAAAAAARVGYPVVLKGLGALFAHKTELGLVALDLKDEAALRAAAARLLATMKGQGELLVQQMVSGKREFLAGMARDAQFGATVTFGLGGIFAEALADVSLRIAPLGRDDAHEMLDEIRAKALLGPVRGLPPVDREALIDTLVGLSRLALERMDIDSIDINPLVISGSRPVAVDALVILR